ncbi:CobW family GTP-binding protein [Cupriavidus oxalaticus]|jgi:G3E family GTPase|nr:CobW family GTP-binding protein [Cupriavidus oxalaticus]QRQ86865.1 GTP-binding protein [Cupriavidus oxalaticus]QRQ94807.1 GTP-binding protein [Cupriavidus oxalaticus]WQD83459.1 CobW family GTP-binding protein [Cupriavidus oxalaticus]SPC16699.1 conserved hypothetical protein [Cupriavidus oxalaticus]
MMRRPDIPLTVLGGFLGAGKTSLLNHLLRTQQGERVLVMVNDFGAINIDAELIAKAAPGMPEGIVSLTNGCVCCSVGGDLMQAFLTVLKLPEPPGRIVVEASGVGDPARIAQLGRAGGGFRSEGVVTVADAEAVRRLAGDRYVGDTVRAQLRAADLVLLNKADLVGAGELDALRGWLGTQVPDARVIACQHGQVDARLILGPAPGAIEAAARAGAGREGGHGVAMDTDHAAAFSGSSFASSIRFRRAALEGALNALPPQVLRGKGMVFLEGEDSPRLLQICGKRWTLERPGPPEAAARSRIVFIAAKQAEGATFDPWRHFSPALAG